MKIAIIVHNLSCGGAERVATMWAKGFVSQGYEVVVMIYDGSSPHTYSLPDHVKLVSMASHVKNRIGRIIQRGWQLRNQLKKEKPDVVIDVIPAYWKRMSMIGLNCYKVSTEHNTFERPQNAEKKAKKLQKIYLNRLYDHVTVLTQADKKVVGNKLKHVTVLPNPLALEPIGENIEKKNIVLAVGCIDGWYEKGFDVLVKAWAKVILTSEDWELCIVGDSKGEGFNYLKSLCKELNIQSSVRFSGFTDNIQQYYQSASIFVLSSRYEGFGLVLIEAMSQGCACVACDYKGRQREIIRNDEEGIVCKPDSVDDLAVAIKNLMSNSGLLKSMREKSIMRSKDFSIDIIMQKWEEILEPIKQNIIEV